jgi:hypothetical protein
MGPPVVGSASVPHRHHSVHFYEEGGELMGPLTDFVQEGLDRNERVVFIIVPERWKELRKRLPARTDPERLVVFDARTVVDRLLVDGQPDPGRFAELVRNILAATGGRPFRAFGEGVDLLTRDGKFEAAIQLEELWNGALQDRSFPLFCAYDVNVFYRNLRGSEYRHLRRIHDHVLPA